MSGSTSKAALVGAVIAGVLVVVCAIGAVWRVAERASGAALFVPGFARSLPAFPRSGHGHHPRHTDSDDSDSGDSDSDSGSESGGGTISNTRNGVEVGGGIQYNGHTVNPSAFDGPLGSAGASGSAFAPRCAKVMADPASLRAAMANAAPNEVICLRFSGLSAGGSGNVGPDQISIEPMPGN
ncbi:MAG TPA: hypothetical protein VGH89_05565 [Pseudonocardia sp.]|jgi:hypothetical protein